MNLEKLHQYRDDILKLAGQYHSANVRVFGSVARGEATETSDVDFIIDRTPEQDLFDFIRFARAPSFWGVKLMWCIAAPCITRF